MDNAASVQNESVESNSHLNGEKVVLRSDPFNRGALPDSVELVCYMFSRLRYIGSLTCDSIPHVVMVRAKKKPQVG